MSVHDSEVDLTGSSVYSRQRRQVKRQYYLWCARVRQLPGTQHGKFLRVFLLARRTKTKTVTEIMMYIINIRVAISNAAVMKGR